MLSTSTETTAPVRQPVPVPTTTRDPLRAELEGLNESLRELKSTDHAVRSYIEMWISFVCLAAAGKLIYDWQKTGAKAPMIAFPLIFLGLAVLVDTIAHKRKQLAMERDEAARLKRQRELRGLLGLDEAEFPATQPSRTPDA